MKKILAMTAAVLSGVVAHTKVLADPAPQRPNFIFIYTDDQRWDAMSCVQEEMGDKGRFPWFKTPNMDRLAREGVRFRNAFVTDSLCAPSRSVFLTGMYNHLNGVANNHTPAPLDLDNHAKELDKVGYNTVYIGKWHHAKQVERPGFEFIYSYLGQGDYIDYPFNVNGTMTPTKGWIDDVSTDFAIDFLKQHGKEKPFDMVLGFKSPHDPRIPADRAKHRFDGTVGRPVPNFDSLPPYPAGNGLHDPHKPWTEYRRDYFRAISSADDCLGRLLDALDEMKLADNTVVVFTTDNGYYMGEHGLGDKRSAYDESLRIPLLIRYPGHIPAGKVIDQMVLNIDYPSTVLDYAGVPAAPSMQGHSWKPLLEGKTDDWRSAWFYEYFWEKNYDCPTITAVRTDTAKLIKYQNHPEWTELFDLKNDPYEMKNLASTNPEMRSEMEKKYQEEAEKVKFKIPSYADKQAGAK